MPDEELVALGPKGFGDEGLEVRFDVVRLEPPREAQPPRQPPHVGVHREGRLPANVDAHHASGFVAHAGKRGQRRPTLWDFAGMVLKEGRGDGLQCTGLGAEEAAALN
jgi:hypothetical protein